MSTSSCSASDRICCDCDDGATKSATTDRRTGKGPVFEVLFFIVDPVDGFGYCNLDCKYAPVYDGRPEPKRPDRLRSHLLAS